MIDQVTISVRAGNGGHGSMSFRHEKYVPFGGPDGGDGGRGGDVAVKAVDNLATLQEYRGRATFMAERGGNGRGKKMTGRRGKDRVLEVPIGTVVRWHGVDGEERLADLVKQGATVLVAQGGEPGRGNVHFASATNRTPRLAERGEPGEEAEVTLELKLLADVGIIGLPNAGKSSLLAASTHAHPRVGPYPFTTIEPNLGVVNMGWMSFVMADIPGLIEGAHAGRGLGDQFLRHIERTAVLVHLVNGSQEDPVRAWRTVNEELAQYSEDLAKRPQVTAVNKIDIPEVQARQDELRRAFRRAGVTVSFVSAASGEGVKELLEAAYDHVQRARTERAAEVIEPPPVILRPKPRRVPARVEPAGLGVWRVIHPRVERLVGLADLKDMGVVAQLWRELTHVGAVRALEKAGAQPGDRVLLGPAELEWR